MNCTRCGIEITNNTLIQRRLQGNESTMCSDCNHLDRPFADNTKSCRAWVGELDRFDRPIRNGKLYKPGKRLCGRADCVKTAHIDIHTPDTPKAAREASEAFFERLRWDESLVAEQYDISYRTGKQLTHKQLIKRLQKEVSK